MREEIRRMATFTSGVAELTRNRAEDLLELMRDEIKRQIESLGVASARDLERLERRVARLESSGAGHSSSDRTRQGSASGSSKKSAERSASGRKAAAHKTTAPKATARKTTARKTTARKTTARKPTSGDSS